MSEAIDKFKELKPKLEKLKVNIESVIRQMVGEKGIPVFGIESRVKDEDSFTGKVARKLYENPLDQIDDLCGVRVICYYQEDIGKICELVESEFEVVEKEDKKESLSDDQFGYTSHHYVVRLKKEWLGHPGARGLDGLRAEIQIRTMLMHTWAAISHKLLYKSEKDVPAQFKRQLNRLSALIELADEQFDSMKNIKLKLTEELASNNLAVQGFSELSSDALMAVYNRYFSERDHQDMDIPYLLEDIRSVGLDYKGLVEKIELCLPFLNDIEKDEVDFEMRRGGPGRKTLPKWRFAGAIRTILDLTDEDYFERRSNLFPDELVEMVKKYRGLIKKQAH
ncbi:(p)ppGpp synthetase [Pseudomonas glycinae]|uniref:GTP pyrophosphokinase n=1 Tax=Pseudomonas glycinae TaxID=1785145 RepID=UPI0018D746A0|nr:(p)ppGpp synthetase [Pseudomonas glycinae]MBH3408766.1 (p)ppGpp synthetase [Pseudomonas glycinae]